ncbi:MAG: DNA-directed RNA polymerase subunit beta, partial [Actinobacteria bacterium]|nr:DNA-directed RNA polymerase subunit beta [Actinomycetota bacterium]
MQPSFGIRKRRSFAKTTEIQPLPDLISIQTRSFKWFLEEGLAETLREISPIEDFTGNLSIEFGGYRFGKPEHDADECKERDMTFAARLDVVARLINKTTGEIKEEEVYMGDFPVMTEYGTFIINGTERVVVSQLVRSPGVYFDREMDKASDKTLYFGKVIPGRGAWLELETDKKDAVYVRVDRKRKQPVTILMKALGYGDNEQILELFENTDAIKATLERDFTESREEALVEIYKRLRPGEPPSIESARSLIDNLFFNPQRYDLAKVGRHKVNKKLGLDVPIGTTVLTKEDILTTVQYLIALVDENAFRSRFPFVEIDDIDHFGNRRLRSVGELIQNQFRIGLARMERVVRERMTTLDIETMTPRTLINIRPIVAAIKEFFGSSQLSQFMDQTNPLAGLTHKRRLSALGPGGLSRERAGFEVRDVHSSHYGRMCPIETPEGPNIGLIGSLACYARINEFGFVETPFRKVGKGKITDEIHYLTADDQDRYVIAQANEPFDEETREFKNTTVLVQIRERVEQVLPEEVQYMDVSP